MIVNSTQVINILVVEDNAGEARLIKEALKNSKTNTSLHFVCDGVQAMNFMNRIEEYLSKPRPDLIILDLNLPKKDGREVLRELKSNDSFKFIPILVMSSSQAEEDIMKSYNLHANCYISKPIDFNEFTDIIRSIDDFWFTTVKLPPSLNV